MDFLHLKISSTLFKLQEFTYTRKKKNSVSWVLGILFIQEIQWEL